MYKSICIYTIISFSRKWVGKKQEKPRRGIFSKKLCSYEKMSAFVAVANISGLKNFFYVIESIFMQE